jgi:hypothetical protein
MEPGDLADGIRATMLPNREKGRDNPEKADYRKCEKWLKVDGRAYWRFAEDSHGQVKGVDHGEMALDE